MMTSSICATGTRARFRASVRAIAPSWGAGTSARAPRYLPIGVRAADTMKASAISASFCLAMERDSLISIINWCPHRTMRATDCMLLRTEHLTKDYNGFRALDDLQLAIGPGEVFGLLGPNGSGKTTALRVILGFLKPTAGSASIDGHDCWHDGVAARRLLSYLPGELRLYENMTGRQLVSFLSKLRG